MEFIDPAQVYWDDWLLLAVQLLTLVFLVIYVVKTWQMASATSAAAKASASAAKATAEGVDEARRARLDDVAPRFAVYFDATPSLNALIIVENVGRGTARDVTLDFSPPLHNPNYEWANKLLDQVQPIMAPGHRLKHMFGAWPDYLENPDTPKEYRVTVNYAGVENDEPYEVTQVLSCDAMRERVMLDGKGVHHVAEATEGLRDEVKRLLSDLDRRDRNARGRLNLPSAADKSASDLAEALLAAWDTYRFISASPGTAHPWSPVLEELRRQAFTAAWSTRVTYPHRELRTAIDDVTLHVFGTHAEVFGNADWFAKGHELFAALRRVLDVAGQGSV